jgi:hypothetical protein
MNNATKIRVSRLKSGYEIYIMDGNVAYKNFFITSWEVPTFVKEIGNTFKRNISISDVILAFTNAEKEDAYFEVYKSSDIVSNTINSILEHSIYENKEIVEIQKEVKIGKIVLEKGDKIKIMKESQPWIGTLVNKKVVEVRDYSESRGVVRILFSDNTSIDMYDWAWYSY